MIKKNLSSQGLHQWPVEPLGVDKTIGRRTSTPCWVRTEVEEHTPGFEN